MTTHAIVPVQAQVPEFQLADIERIANAIARGGLFGSKDPMAVLTLCLLAQAEGQHPAVVFRDYDIIQGKPSKKSEAMLRDFIMAGGKVTWNRLDDECAEAVFSHPQGGEVTINWTLARAQKAGLGGKEMWKKYPRAMLRSRVVSEGVRTVCPSATSGLEVPEEVIEASDSDTPSVPKALRSRDLKQQLEQSVAELEAEAAPEPDSNRGKAELWLAQYEADLRAAPDLDAFMAVQTKAEKALAKLFDEHPDLYAKALNLGTELAPEQPETQEADLLREQEGA